MHSLSSEISDSGNARNKQRKIGGNTRGKTTNKQKGKGEAQAPEEFLSNGVLSRSAGTPG